MKADLALQKYFEEAQSWELDRAKRAEDSKRIAWRVAAAALAIAALAVAAVMGLTPLKQPVPVVIRVDSSTGVVDIVPTYEGTTNIEQIVSRSLLTAYTTARERYFYGTAEADYALIAAQNSPQLNQAWYSIWERANPQSPLNLYKDGTSVRVQVRSITFLKLASGKENVAQVRFTKFARPGGTGDEQITHWLSTVEFTYIKPSEDNAIRTLNPLGFRVLEYRREPEVVATSADSGPRQ